MPFDGTDFEPSPAPPPPPARRGQETVLCVVFFVLALMLLILPISADTLVDLVRYLLRRPA